MNEKRNVIGRDEVRAAAQRMREYKSGKSALEARIVDNEQWYRLRHGDKVGAKAVSDPEAVSAWLFNSIANKHADAMDNIPEPVILPREEGDEEQARLLSQVVPVILERNDFEEVYSDAWWYKLKQGTAVYGVFWDRDRDQLGDVRITRVDLLNLFWEPGVSDIQDSPHLFFAQWRDREELLAEYPELSGKLPQSRGDELHRYLYEDTVDTTDKVLVVDWYYKLLDKNGRSVVHYCKFVGDEVLYASENDPALAGRGFYDHGLYPFVFDRLYFAEGTPAGFGCIDVMKSPQLYIDRLNQLLLKNAMQAARKRYFIRDDGSVSEQEFADFSRELIHVTGNLGEDSIRELRTAELPGSVLNLLAMKIEELKETSGNRDFSQGGTASGVTAASAIAALQEAGNKLTRDMLKSSYRAFCRMCRMIVELVRQFYDVPRVFRLTGEGENAFLLFSNEGMTGDAGAALFDVKVRAQKASSFARLTQNETALELFRLGFFRPDMADQAVLALEAMDFEGRERILRAVKAQSALARRQETMEAEMRKMAQIIDAQNGTTIARELEGGSLA